MTPSPICLTEDRKQKDNSVRQAGLFQAKSTLSTQSGTSSTTTNNSTKELLQEAPTPANYCQGQNKNIRKYMKTHNGATV